MTDARELRRQWVRGRYRIDWLHPEDATNVAAIEAEVHTSAHRAGSALIAEQLAVTADEGRNLSLGLYRGDQLVGFLLAFVAQSRREIAEYFDAPLPPDRDPDQRTVYLADFVVLPRHRVATSLLGSRFASILRGRDDLRSLTADAFSTEEYAAFWQARAKYFMRMGWQIGGQAPFHDATLGTTMYWLTFDPVHAVDKSGPPAIETVLKTPQTLTRDGIDYTVGHLDAAADWATLEPHWAKLLERTVEPTVHPSVVHLQRWWTHVGAVNELFMPVVLRDGAAVALAPLQIVNLSWMGRQLRCLSFMNRSPDAGASTILVGADDVAAIDALATCIIARNDLWDCVQLALQAPDNRFIETLARQLRASGLLVAVVPGEAQGVLVRPSSWNDYRNTLPVELGEALECAEGAFKSTGGVEFEAVTAAADWQSLLERFVAVERAAPEASQYQGMSATSANLAFYLDIAARQCEALGMTFGFVKHQGADIAATFGYQWHNTYYPVHVACTAAASAHRAEVLAIARQLEGCFRNSKCERAVLPDDRLPLQLEWATHVHPTVTLSAYRRSPSGLTLHALYSVLKPALKRLTGSSRS